MAIPKVCGIETEYGIQHVGGDRNPVAASSLLVNAYVADLARRSRLGLRGRVARATTPAASPAKARCRPRSRPISSTPCSPTGPATTSTTPTPSTRRPSARRPRGGRSTTRPGRRSCAARWTAARRLLPDGQSIVVYKNNSDGKGNSYGTHENYLMDRAVPFARIVNLVTPHFVTRQIFTGAGKVGSETPAHDGAHVDFQISQRAEFFEEEVGLETTLKRPIVNTRDEPHADPQRYRRLHVIVGDANLAEVATFLKVGTTALVLAMIEDDASGEREPGPGQPGAGHAPGVARPDPAHAARAGRRLDRHRPRRSSGSCSAWPASTPRTAASSASGDEAVGETVLDRWEAVLHGLETDPMSLVAGSSTGWPSSS